MPQPQLRITLADTGRDVPTRKQRVWVIARGTYIPAFLAEIGLGAMLPLFALSVVALDHSAAWAAAVVMLYSVGRMIGSSMGGRLTTSLGCARAAMVGLAGLAAGAIVCWLSTDFVALVAGVMLAGAGHAAYHVARQGQLSETVPTHYRARALTSLAGTWRISHFIGPLIGAGVIAVWGLSAAYAFAALTVVVGMAALWASPGWHSRASAEPRPHASIKDVVRANTRVLATLGMAVMLTGAVRTVRVAAIPLWAEHVGASDSTVSLIFALSAGVDMLLFYPAGIVADRWGRAWTAVPSTMLIALGLIALPFTETVAGVAVAAMVLGLGNGWGSGILMTLGNDVAPKVGRDAFIGVWMILQDLGGVIGPAAVSALVAVSLPWSLWIIGGVGVATSGALAAWIPPRPVEEAGKSTSSTP
ncbi:MFS transporter [Demequina flava]|uniref:MFS transporter n=1 Tax=Demequina flava TaxID=1095025 RepID=UPI000785C70E|nr:MFS transporter [Demequina flava]